MPQKIYWQVLVDLRFYCFYLDLYRRLIDRIDYWIGVLLAVASSGSIGAWTVWKEVPMLWGAIIAGSQVIHTMRPFLPGKAQRAKVAALGNDLDRLAIQVEEYWLSVRNGEATEQDIVRMVSQVRGKLQESQIKHFGDRTLREIPSLKRTAEERAKNYLDIYST